MGKDLYRIKGLACDALQRVDEADFRDPQSVGMVKNLVSIIQKVCDMDDGMEYSHAGGWDATGYYDDGRGGMGLDHTGGGRSYRRGRSMVTGRYVSRAGDGMMEHLEDMMQEAKTPEEREMVQRFMREAREMK